MSYFLIMIGGAIGALLRYFIYVRLDNFEKEIPLNIISINVLGCFIMGMIIALIPNKTQEYLFFSVGILGSFTTMSAFTSQTFNLIMANKYLLASIYICLTIVLCIFSTIAAYWIFK